MLGAQPKTWASTSHWRLVPPGATSQSTSITQAIVPGSVFATLCLLIMVMPDLDDMVLEHSALFDKVPEYNGLKRPKHHFLCHLALDIWRFGPPRGYWCFGFEHFNQLIKRAAQSSNWKSTTVSIMRYWSAYSARNLAARAA